MISSRVLPAFLLAFVFAASAGAAEQARPRVGLVLSGGGARGAAHVGVLKVLDEMRVPVDAIAGTSMGAVVGGLYASGMSALQINKIALDMDQAAISDWALPFRSRGLLQGVALQNFLNKTLNNRPIEKMAKLIAALGELERHWAVTKASPGFAPGWIGPVAEV